MPAWTGGVQPAANPRIARTYIACQCLTLHVHCVGSEGATDFSQTVPVTHLAPLPQGPLAGMVFVHLLVAGLQYLRQGKRGGKACVCAATPPHS